MKIKLKTKAHVVLDALFLGRTIDFMGEKVSLVEHNLMIERIQEKDGIRSDILLGLDISLSSFLKQCDEISDDYIYYILCGEMAIDD